MQASDIKIWRDRHSARHAATGGCAAESDFDHNVALEQLKRFCKAEICRGDEVDLQPGRRRRTRVT